VIESPLLALIFLFCANLVTGLLFAMSRMGKFQAELICAENNRHFLLKYPAKFLFVKKNRELLSFALPLLKYLLLLGYAAFAFSFLFSLLTTQPALTTLFEACLILLIYIGTDVLFQGLSICVRKCFLK
jgi:hypothetical protein